MRYFRNSENLMTTTSPRAHPDPRHVLGLSGQGGQARPASGIHISTYVLNCEV